MKILNKNKLARKRNKILGSGCLINNKHLYLTVLETGKSQIMAPVDSVSG